MKTPHPNLNDLKEILGYLEIFLSIHSGVPLKFPNRPDFEQDDKTPQEVADLWFRTNSPTTIRAVLASWKGLLTTAREPYFIGKAATFDYGDTSIAQYNRHPVFNEVHPFIMLSRVPRTGFGEDPVDYILNFFIEAWRAFIDVDYTKFELGKAVVLEDQAFAEGYFTITQKAAFHWKNTNIHQEVKLWRSLMITARANSVDIMNVGIPAAGVGGSEYLQHFRDWMNEFRELNA
jgi:hypothetical protein